MVRRFLPLNYCFAGFIFICLVTFNYIATSFASPTITFKDEGLKCSYASIEDWKVGPSLFGFSSFLYKEMEAGMRATLALVVTPLSGNSFESDNLNKELELFADEKKKFLEKEGGEILSSKKIISDIKEKNMLGVSIQFKLEDTIYNEITLFRFINHRLIHIKALYPEGKVSPELMKNQIRSMIGGITCQ